jgi:hypothetical protein
MTKKFTDNFVDDFKALLDKYNVTAVHPLPDNKLQFSFRKSTSHRRPPEFEVRGSCYYLDLRINLRNAEQELKALEDYLKSEDFQFFSKLENLLKTYEVFEITTKSKTAFVVVDRQLYSHELEVTPEAIIKYERATSKKLYAR